MHINNYIFFVVNIDTLIIYVIYWSPSPHQNILLRPGVHMYSTASYKNFNTQKSFHNLYIAIEAAKYGFKRKLLINICLYSRIVRINIIVLNHMVIQGNQWKYYKMITWLIINHMTWISQLGKINVDIWDEYILQKDKDINEEKNSMVLGDIQNQIIIWFVLGSIFNKSF